MATKAHVAKTETVISYESDEEEMHMVTEHAYEAVESSGAWIIDSEIK